MYRFIKESKLVHATEPTSFISHLVVNSVVENNQSCFAGNVQTNAVKHSDKNILNEKGSAYMVTVKPSTECIVTVDLSSINENNSMSSIHSLVQSTGKKSLFSTK